MDVKLEPKKRTASDCGFTNTDSLPASKKVKLEIKPEIAKQSRPKGTKRKVALIVSYLGTNYHGSAFSGNPNCQTESVAFPTVSSEIFKTLCKIGAVSEQNSNDPKKVSFSASSRTDKGVHAAAAPFALKMIDLFADKQKESVLNPPQIKKKHKNKNKNKNTNENESSPTEQDKKEELLKKEELIQQKCEYSQWNQMKDLINKSLSCSDIRIQSIQRTTKAFNPKLKAWSRVYHYIIPTYLFDANIKAKDITYLEQKFCQSLLLRAKARELKNESNNSEMKENKCEMPFKKEKDIRFGYRISADLVKRLKELCQMYIGTRNYHNFTRKIHPKEDRAKRYMHAIDVINPSLTVEGMEYLQFEIHGTSFLYHQIRKMIGLMVALMRNIKYEFGGMNEKKYCNECKELQSMAFSFEYKMAIPLAPSQGLYLKTVKFDEYNKKCVRDGQEWKQLKLERYKQGIDQFVMDKILPAITKHEVNKENELKGNQFAFWLYSLENEFKYEIVKISPELKQKLKEKGIEYVSAGNTHEERDTFYQKIMNKMQNDQK